MAQLVAPSSARRAFAAGKVNTGVPSASDDWTAKVFVDNGSNEAAPVAQVTGLYTPMVTVQRPRTIGLRLAFRGKALVPRATPTPLASA